MRQLYNLVKKNVFLLEIRHFIEIILKLNPITYRNSLKCLSSFGGNLLSKRYLSNYKKSDRLYILGSGESINLLTDDQISEIKNHDSIGMNQWCFHNEIFPTFYSLEFEVLNKKDGSELQSEINKKIVDEVMYKWEKYAATIFIVKPRDKVLDYQISLFKKIKEGNKLFWNNSFLIPGTNIVFVKFYLFLIKFFRILNFDNVFLNKAASLFWCILFAYKLEYKEIILVGVDLKGNYFYDVITNSDSNSFVHLTANPLKVSGGVTIQDLIISSNEILFKPNNIRICVLNNNYSLLNKILPGF